MKPGGITELKVIDCEALSVFNKAFEGHVGTVCVPLLVSTQVVSGINYIFICNTTTVSPDPDTYSTVVSVWAKPDGTVELTEIKNLSDML